MHVPPCPLSFFSLSYFSFKPHGLTANLSGPSFLIVGISQIPYSAARQLPNATEWIPGSDDQYIVELDVFHQLHCLNAIRKTFFPERYRHVFKDYWLDDGSPPGKAGRNYTSTDAKHYGEFLFITIPLPFLSPRGTNTPSVPKQTTASTPCGNPSCVTATSPPSTGAGSLRAISPYPASASPTPAASSIGSATGARSTKFAPAGPAKGMSPGGKRGPGRRFDRVFCRDEI